MATYQELLSDPRWQTRRTSILDRDNWECQSQDCPGTSNHLHVHHLWYARGRLPWQYPDEALITLCADCHEAQHTQPAQKAARRYGMMALRILLFPLTVTLAILGPIVAALCSVVAVICVLAAVFFGGLLHLPGFPGWGFFGVGVALMAANMGYWAVRDKLGERRPWF